jgi:hypothetical protein
MTVRRATEHVKIPKHGPARSPLSDVLEQGVNDTVTRIVAQRDRLFSVVIR